MSPSATKPSPDGGRTAPTSPTTPTAPATDCSKAKCIALTFDDGPGPYTGRLLDILKQERVPATFFVLGQRAEEYPALVRREAEEGHLVGNHTYDHKDLSKLSAAGITREIERSADAIQAAGAPRPTLLRPPYGAVNDTVRQLAGQPLIMWRVDPEDWKYRDAAVVAQKIVSRAKVGRIVLSHDIQKTTVEAMPEVIRELRAAGYVLVTVRDLMAGADLQNGKSYFNRPPALDPAAAGAGAAGTPEPSATAPETSGDAPASAGSPAGSRTGSAGGTF